MSKKRGRAETASPKNNILLILLSLTLTLVALVIYPNTVDQYSLPKTTLLYLSTICLLFFFIARALKEKKIVIYRSSLDLPVLLFASYAVVALLSSSDPVIGLVGQYGRYEGLPSVICYAFIYFITMQAVRSERDFEFLLKIMAIGFVPIAIYGLIQTAGLDFLNISLYGLRAHSTFGNPVLFGAYLVTMLPLLTGLARYSKEESWRMFSWFLLVLGIINLIGTESRGAWVGIAISVLAAVIIKFRAVRLYKKTAIAKKRPQRKSIRTKRKTVAILLVIAITLAALLFIVSASKPVERIVSVFSLTEETVVLRIEIWKTSLSMIKDKPLTGFGFEQMKYWFPVYETAKFARIVGASVADRAHNDLLQVGIDAGIPAILIYLWIVVIVALKARESQRKLVYSTTLTCAIIGYATQAQTGITSVFIGPMIWSLIGVVLSVTNQRKPLKIQFRKKTNLKPAVYVIGAACLTLGVLAFLPFMADQHVFKGQTRTVETEKSETFGFSAIEYETAIRIFPYQNRYNKRASEYYMSYATELQNTVFAKTAAFIAKNGLEYNKRDYELSYYVGEASFIDYRISENNLSLEEAEEFYKLTLRLHPFHDNAMSRLLYIAVLRNDKKKAIDYANKLISIGVEDVSALAILAENARLKGQTEKANRYMDKLKDLNHSAVSQSRSR